MSPLAPKLRQQLAATAKRAGLEEQASKAYRAISPLARRNHKDDVNLRMLIAFLLQHDSNAIDVGAHSGDILEQLVHVAPEGKHIAIEPLPEHAADLAKRFPDVDVHHAALAAEAGSAEFTQVTSNMQLSGLRNRSFAGEETTTFEVEIKRLDDIVDPELEIALIKIDVEGAELGVFQGGLETIRRARPTLVFEHGIGGADHFGTKPSDVHDLLAKELGYRIFDIDGTGPYTRDAFDAVFSEPIWFFVAHP